jgi:Flp pilus assembly protein TadB
MTVLAAACAALAVLLAHRPGRPRAPIPRGPRPPSDVRRQRGVAAALAVVAGLTWGRDLLGPLLGPAVGLAGAALVWTAAGRGESSAERRATLRARADLPHLVGLTADAVRAGSDPAHALRHAADALPGPTADRLLARTHALSLGADPAAVWRRLADDPALAPLGRALARAHESGTPVADAIARLAVRSAEQARAEVEDRARRVGVRAAVPLGLCLLPSFVVLGIVPLAAALLADLW